MEGFRLSWFDSGHRVQLSGMAWQDQGPGDKVEDEKEEKLFLSQICSHITQCQTAYQSASTNSTTATFICLQLYPHSSANIRYAHCLLITHKYFRIRTRHTELQLITIAKHKLHFGAKKNNNNYYSSKTWTVMKETNIAQHQPNADLIEQNCSNYYI